LELEKIDYNQETLCVNAIHEDFGALRKEGTPAQDPRSNMQNQGRLKSLKSARTTCARARTVFDEAHANLSRITADQNILVYLEGTYYSGKTFFGFGEVLNYKALKVGS